MKSVEATLRINAIIAAAGRFWREGCFTDTTRTGIFEKTQPRFGFLEALFLISVISDCKKILMLSTGCLAVLRT